MDIDGNGDHEGWETNICRLCLMAVIVLAFGKEALTVL